MKYLHSITLAKKFLKLLEVRMSIFDYRIRMVGGVTLPREVGSIPMVIDNYGKRQL